MAAARQACNVASSCAAQLHLAQRGLLLRADVGEALFTIMKFWVSSALSALKSRGAAAASSPPPPPPRRRPPPCAVRAASRRAAAAPPPPRSAGRRARVRTQPPHCSPQGNAAPRSCCCATAAARGTGGEEGGSQAAASRWSSRSRLAASACSLLVRHRVEAPLEHVELLRQLRVIRQQRHHRRSAGAHAARPRRRSLAPWIRERWRSPQSPLRRGPRWICEGRSRWTARPQPPPSLSRRPRAAGSRLRRRAASC